MTEEAKILRQTRKVQGLDIRSFTNEVNSHLPEPFGYTFGAFSKWERGKSPLPYYTFVYLSQRATGWVQVMAQNVVAAMRPKVVEAAQPADIPQVS